MRLPLVGFRWRFLRRGLHLLLLQLSLLFFYLSCQVDPATEFDKQLVYVLATLVLALIYVGVSGKVHSNDGPAMSSSTGHGAGSGRAILRSSVEFIGAMVVASQLIDVGSPKERVLSAAYNRIMLVVFTGLVLTVGSLGILAWRTLTKRQWIALVATAALTAAARASYLMATRNDGLFGRSLDTTLGECTLGDGFPYVGMLPRRAANFFMGFYGCSADEDRIVAELDYKADLIRFLPAAVKRKGSCQVTVNPDWGSWRVGTDEYEEMKRLYEIHRPEVHIPWRGEPIPWPKDAEFVLASCGINSDNPQMIVHVARKSAAVKRALALGSKPTGEYVRRPSAMLIVLDSLSRRHFMRRMPITVDFLEREAKERGFSVFQFFRYNSVGGNTFPNLSAMLAGESAVHRPTRDLSSAFVWKSVYEKLGYVSMYSCAICQDYFRWYWSSETPGVDHELDYAFCNPDYEPAKRNNFIGPYSIGERCLQGSPVSSVSFQHAREFAEKYSDVNRFSMVKLLEGHEGSMEVITTLDEPLRDFLDWITRAQRDTFTVLCADHGNHMSLYTKSHSGFSEWRLPFLFLLVPDSFLEKNPRARMNLLRNEQRLVTAHDIHATLSDGAKGDGYGVSLLDEIPEKRTCGQAGIQQWWCACDAA